MVRRRCGFGCVVCGLPLYEYEHVLGWSEVQRHRPEEITLLCDRHHREKTGGLLPVSEVEKANASPYNLRVGVSHPYDLHFSGDHCRVSIGGNTFIARRSKQNSQTRISALRIDETTLIGFTLEDGHLLLNVSLYDEDNELILRIANNELTYSLTPWDISLVGRRLEVRERQREFLIRMEFNVPSEVVISRAHLMRNGVELVVMPDFALIVNNRLLISGSGGVDKNVGIGIGKQPRWDSCMFSIEGVPRRTEFDRADRNAALRWAREQRKV